MKGGAGAGRQGGELVVVGVGIFIFYLEVVRHPASVHRQPRAIARCEVGVVAVINNYMIVAREVAFHLAGLFQVQAVLAF